MRLLHDLLPILLVNVSDFGRELWHHKFPAYALEVYVVSIMCLQRWNPEYYLGPAVLMQDWDMMRNVEHCGAGQCPGAEMALWLASHVKQCRPIVGLLTPGISSLRTLKLTSSAALKRQWAVGLRVRSVWHGSTTPWSCTDVTATWLQQVLLLVAFSSPSALSNFSIFLAGSFFATAGLVDHSPCDNLLEQHPKVVCLKQLRLKI